MAAQAEILHEGYLTKMVCPLGIFHALIDRDIAENGTKEEPETLLCPFAGQVDLFREQQEGRGNRMDANVVPLQV